MQRVSSEALGGCYLGSTENKVFSSHRKGPIHHLSVPTQLARLLSWPRLCFHWHCSSGYESDSTPVPSAQLLWRTSASFCRRQSEMTKKLQLRKHSDDCCAMEGDTSIFSHVWLKGENSIQMTPARFLVTQLSKADFLPPSVNSNSSLDFESIQRLVYQRMKRSVASFHSPITILCGMYPVHHKSYFLSLSLTHYHINFKPKKYSLTSSLYNKGCWFQANKQTKQPNIPHYIWTVDFG